MSERPRVLVELGVEIERAARRSLPAPRAGAGAAATHAVRDRGRLRLRVLPIAALLLLGGAAAAIAAGLISSGAPASATHAFASPDARLGKIVPGSERLLPISTPDPAGGPPWGMRVLKATRGAGCIQVGRLVDGRLVALGQDDAFEDDGRAHPLPPSAGVERLKCSLLDRRGNIYDSITLKNVAASAAPGEQCRPPGTYAQRSSLPACPLADERNLYFGLLGPMRAASPTPRKKAAAARSRSVPAAHTCWSRPAARTATPARPAATNARALRSPTSFPPMGRSRRSSTATVRPAI